MKRCKGSSSSSSSSSSSVLEVLGEGMVLVDDNHFQSLPVQQGGASSVINSTSLLRLQVEYVRELDNTSSGVVQRLRVRLGEGEGSSLEVGRSDVDVGVDLQQVVKCQGGGCYLGIIGTGLQLSNSREREGEGEGSSVGLGVELVRVHYKGKGAMHSYPVASPLTATKYPDSFVRIEAEMNQFRSWLHLRLHFQVPSCFRIVFDADSITSYERLFSSIMKVIYRINILTLPLPLFYSLQCGITTDPIDR